MKRGPQPKGRKDLLRMAGKTTTRVQLSVRITPSFSLCQRSDIHRRVGWASKRINRLLITWGSGFHRPAGLRQRADHLFDGQRPKDSCRRSGCREARTAWAGPNTIRGAHLPGSSRMMIGSTSFLARTVRWLNRLGPLVRQPGVPATHGKDRLATNPITRPPTGGHTIGGCTYLLERPHSPVASDSQTKSAKKSGGLVGHLTRRACKT